LLTASVFLRLANLVSDPASSDPIPRAEPSEAQNTTPALVLELPQNRLEELKRGPGRKLALDVENGSAEELSDVTLALDVVSDDTANPRARYYQEAIEKLVPAETATIEFDIDLSLPILPQSRDTNQQARNKLGRSWRSGLRPPRGFGR
jgi:hypothetical protein